MRTACVDENGKATQAVAANIAARQQIGLGQVGDGLAAKGTDRSKLHPHRAASIVGGHRCDDGHIVGRPAAYHARMFTTKVGVIELHVAGQWLKRITLGHGRHQLDAPA